MRPKRKKNKLLALCARGSYKVSFKACFVDLGGLEKHNFSTVLLENSRKRHSMVWFSINSHKATWACFRTGCHCPITALNSFKVELFVATPKLIVTTAKQVHTVAWLHCNSRKAAAFTINIPWHSNTLKRMHKWARSQLTAHSGSSRYITTEWCGYISTKALMGG